MVIELHKHKRTWRANMRELPGSPPVGEGATQVEAIASLFFRVIVDPVDWRKYMGFTQLEIVYTDNSF
jgi:hypothetical protein